MVNLLKAELLRLVSRRTVWAVLLGLAALTVLQGLMLTNLVTPLTEQDYAEAQRSYETDQQYWEEEWRAECDADPNCYDSRDMTSAADYLRHVYSLEGFIEVQFGSGAVVLLLVAAFTAIIVTAADFGNGALATQLTFTPRRSRVFLARVFAGVTAGVGLTVSTLLAGTLTSSLVFLALREASEFVVTPYLFAVAGRFLVTAVVCVLMASLAAMLLGSVVGALGVTSGVLVVSLFAADMARERQDVLQLLPWPNLEALLNGVYTTGYWATSFDQAEPYEQWMPIELIDFPQALLYFAVLLTVLGIGALWRFRRRDLLI